MASYAQGDSSRSWPMVYKYLTQENSTTAHTLLSLNVFGLSAHAPMLAITTRALSAETELDRCMTAFGEDWRTPYLMALVVHATAFVIFPLDIQNAYLNFFPSALMAAIAGLYAGVSIAMFVYINAFAWSAQCRPRYYETMFAEACFLYLALFVASVVVSFVGPTALKAKRGGVQPESATEGKPTGDV